MTDALVCPSCAARARAARALLRRLRAAARPRGPGCEEPPKSELRERARKVHPGYAEGPLVRVAAARNQAEAELIQGLLLEEGIPSLARRSGGFDVPDFLAAGPRDILVAVRRAWTPRARSSATPRRRAGCPPQRHPRVGARAGGHARLDRARSSSRRAVAVPFFD